MADNVASMMIAVEAKDETTRVLKGVESSIIRFVGAVSASLAAIRVAIFPIEASADFQKELLNVAKTTNFTDEQITKMAEGLKELSYRLNISAVDLAKVAAAGGQMGLGKEGVQGLLAFTEAASRFASVLDVSVEEAGAGIARLSSIFKIAAKDAEKISSLLNEISNNSTAKGAELIDMVQRIGTAGGTLNAQQAAALAATGRDLGLTVETVGTSFNKVFLSLQSKAKDVSSLIGMPVEQFSDLLRTDGVAALKLYLQALSKLDNVQRATIAQNLTGGGRIFALVTSLINDANNDFDILDRHLAQAATGFNLGTSAIKEQERVLQGLLAQLQILKNVATGVAESVGREALPYITSAIKKLQDWAKDPAFVESFRRGAEYIGGFVDKLSTIITALASVSSGFSPLFKVLGYFVEYKILSGILGMTAALIKNGAAAANTAKAWYGLLTANREAVQSIANRAKDVQAANFAAAEAGKPTTPLSGAGKLAMFLDSSLSGVFAKQDAVRESYARINAAESLLNKAVQARATTLGTIQAKMDAILATEKATAQAAYDSTIAGGGTKTSATRARRDSLADSRMQYMRLDVTKDNAEIAYDDAIRRRTTNLRNMGAEAGKVKASLDSMSTGALIIASLRTSIVGVLSVLGRMVSSFLLIGSTIAGVIGLVTFFLDLFGLLDPVINTIKEILGFSNKAEIEQARLAAERTKRLEDEKTQANELAAQYDKLNQSKGKKGTDTSGVTPLITGGVAEAVGTLNIIYGKYKQLSFAASETAANTSLIDRQLIMVGSDIEKAKEAYDNLLSSQNTRKKIGGITDFLIPLSKANLAEEARALDEAKKKIKDLEESYSLLNKARNKFGEDGTKTQTQMEAVAKQAAEQASKLGSMYDAQGYALLKMLSQVLDAEDKVKAATKERDEAARGGNIPGASDEQQATYFKAEANLAALKASLSSVSAAFDETKAKSSFAANVFLSNAIPDKAKVSAESVKTLMRMLGGVTGDSLAEIQKRAADVKIELAAAEEGLSKVEEGRKKRLTEAAGQAWWQSTATNLFKSAADIRRDTATAEVDTGQEAAKFKNRISDLKAEQQQLALEEVIANRVSEAYKRQGIAKQSVYNPKTAIAALGEATALKSLVEQQVTAQERVVRDAAFNKDRIKGLYTSAVSEVSNAVGSMIKELGGLQSYFASRKLTLKLATFDKNVEFENNAFKKSQEEMIANEKKRLEEMGLSTDEITKQIQLMQEMFDLSDKLRKEDQDETKQKIILNEEQRSINQSIKDAEEANAKAAEYAKQAKDAQAKGNAPDAYKFGTMAEQEAEKAKIAIEDMNSKLSEFKSEAAKPIVGEFGARFLTSDADVKDITERAAKARVDSAHAVANSMEQVNAAFENQFMNEEDRLKSLKTRAEDLQLIIGNIVSISPELAKAQSLIAEKILASTEGISKVTDSLQSIANSDYRGLDQFNTVGAQAANIKEIEVSIKESARVYAETIKPANDSLEATTKAILGNLKVSPEQLQALGKDFAANMVTVIEAAEKPKIGVTFPKAADELQSQLTDKEFVANIKFVNTGAAKAPGYAEGGPIKGPGSGTSDSILMWGSNGEYVMDQKTTSAFGPNFFSWLQKLAQGGKGAMSKFAKAFNGNVVIPAFAGGGYITPSIFNTASHAVEAAVKTSDNIIGRVAVDLTVGGTKTTLIGERQQVDALVKALHSVNRG